MTRLRRTGGEAAEEAPLSLVLVSGGIDSAVALYWARREGHRVRILTFDYHDRPAREVHATLALAEAADAGEVIRVPLPFLREAADAPDALRGNPSLASVPEGYVPARNLVFYAIAFHYAELLGARYIVGGHHGEDPETFPDSSKAFFSNLADLARRGLVTYSERPLEVALPLAGLDKRAVLDFGVELGVPFALTWSCYWNAEAPCGTCASCAERTRAFIAVGIPDPGVRVES